jgi:hypothetical protein
VSTSFAPEARSSKLLEGASRHLKILGLSANCVETSLVLARRDAADTGVRATKLI